VVLVVARRRIYEMRREEEEGEEEGEFQCFLEYRIVSIFIKLSTGTNEETSSEQVSKNLWVSLEESSLAV
jgi:hypothetical protein